MSTTDVRAVGTRAFKQFFRDLLRGTLPGAGGVTVSQLALLTPGYFRLGTGGFILATSGAGTLKVPINPDDGNGYSNRTQLDSDTRVPPLFAYSKALQAGDFTTLGTDLLTLNIQCQIGPGEAINVPAYEFFEIGLFIPANATTAPYAGAGNDLMVAYGTFPKEVQTGVTLTHHVKITF